MSASAAPARGEDGEPAVHPEGPLGLHQRLREQFEVEAERHDATAARFSIAQLVLFLASAAIGGSGLLGGSRPMLGAGAAVFVIFLIVRAVQARFIHRREAAKTRQEIHHRQVMRMTGRLSELPAPAVTIPPGHPYASDLDIVGDGSLISRLDTTHTGSGAKLLASWLAAPAPTAQILERQAAVQELAGLVELRQELEGAVLDTGRERLDADPFVAQMQKKGVLEERPWLVFVAPLLPLVTGVLFVLGQLEILSGWFWLGPLAIQIAIVRVTELRSAEMYRAMGEKKGFVDAYARLFAVVEGSDLQAPMSTALLERLRIDGKLPSKQLRRLDRAVNWYELRETGIVHFLVNPVLLWDLNCLIFIERWVRDVGRKCGEWFDVIGQIEALASLSILLHQDIGARLPEIVDAEEGLDAEQIAHPLLPATGRVANDVRLGGKGTCLIVTGSNMAGKSTLLRAVGINIALALAGGPVVARSMRVPRVRIRASMRIADSLQSGASYFQAELSRLRLVVSRAEADPPIFFLLDEMLRGTNAKARHIGARAVVEHLIARGGLGFVATHDVALSTLEDQHEGKVHNVHFTDVIDAGVMTFDYRLRQGVVRTSNALRLLAEVGIEVPDDPVLTPAIVS